MVLSLSKNEDIMHTGLKKFVNEKINRQAKSIWDSRGKKDENTYTCTCTCACTCTNIST